MAANLSAAEPEFAPDAFQNIGTVQWVHGLMDELCMDNPNAADFRDPITSDIMTDPYIAEDRWIYDKSTIDAWMSSPGNVISDQLVRSPVTGDSMGTALTPATEMKQRVEYLRTIDGATEESSWVWEAFGKQHMLSIDSRKYNLPSGIRAPLVSNSFEKLGKVMKELDPHREILAKSLQGWQFPRIIVVGDESAGKSTILEQLCMLPLFARGSKAGFCTRCAIHVRLRRTPGETPRVLMSVRRADDLETPLEGEKIQLPVMNAFRSVQKKMSELVDELEPGMEGIITDKVIVLEVYHWNVPSIDLIDVPGYVVTPQKKGEAIKKIFDQLVAHDEATQGHSMYLFVVPVGGDARPNVNATKQFFDERPQLLDKAFGVLSKCDQRFDKETLLPLVTGQTLENSPATDYGYVHLKNGWTMSMLKPPAKKHQKELTEVLEWHAFERLFTQRKEEQKFFLAEEDLQHPELANAGGIAALVPKLEAAYDEMLRTTWKDDAMRLIITELQKTDFERIQLLGNTENQNKQELADMEVTHRLKDNIPKISQEFCETILRDRVLLPLEQQLVERQGMDYSFDQIKKNRQELEQITMGIVEQAVSSLKAYWVDKIRSLLTAQISEQPEEVEGGGSGPNQTQTRYNFGIAGITFVLPALRSSLNFITGATKRKELYKLVKRKPFIQLSEYEMFTGEVMSRIEAHVDECAAAVLEQTRQVAHSTFTSSTLGPHFKLTPNRERLDEGRFDGPCQTVHVDMDSKSIAEAVVVAFAQELPSPANLERLHQGVELGLEKQETRDRLDVLNSKYDSLSHTRDDIILHLSITPAEVEAFEEEVNWDLDDAAAA